MKRLYVAYPSSGMMCLEFNHSLSKMVGYLTTTMDVEVQFALDFAMGSNWIANRELIAQNALDMNATHLVFLDDDMMFEPDILVSMLNHDKDIIAVNYPVKEWPARTWTAKDMQGNPIATRADSTGLVEASGTGFGVSIIKTDVFRKIPQPWFMPLWQDAKREYTTEDFPFFGRAREAGYTLWVDQDASKKVHHVGKFKWHWTMVE